MGLTKSKVKGEGIDNKLNKMIKNAVTGGMEKMLYKKDKAEKDLRCEQGILFLRG